MPNHSPCRGLIHARTYSSIVDHGVVLAPFRGVLIQTRRGLGFRTVFRLFVLWMFAFAAHAYAGGNPSCKIESVSGLSVESVSKLVSGPCHLSLNDLIQALPKAFRNSVTFLSFSASRFRQCVNKRNPRVIYFFKNLVLSYPWKGTKFNHPECQGVEMIGKGKRSDTVNPTLITFHSDRQAHVDQTGQKCVECHSANFHPEGERSDYSHPFIDCEELKNKILNISKN